MVSKMLESQRGVMICDTIARLQKIVVCSNNYLTTLHTKSNIAEE
jgi:hypothetical protein